MDVTWKDWADAVALGVFRTPDELLVSVAETLVRAPIVITAGNGGSAALASHAAQALMKPGYRAGGARAAVSLTDMVPTLTAHINDGGQETALLELARPFMCAGAVLWLFSSSGSSRNIARLAREARDRGFEVAAFTGFDGEPLRSLATLSVHVDSKDYEVVEPVHDALLHRVQYHVRCLTGA